MARRLPVSLPPPLSRDLRSRLPSRDASSMCMHAQYHHVHKFVFAFPDYSILAEYYKGRVCVSTFLLAIFHVYRPESTTSLYSTGYTVSRGRVKSLIAHSFLISFQK